MVKLWCGVCGDADIFSVDIQLSQDVETLQVAIANKYKDVINRVPVLSGRLKLYFAGTKDGDKTTWLADDSNADPLLRGQIDKKYERMFSSCTLEKYFGAEFQPGREQIHVLVELPQISAGITSETPVTGQAQQISSIDDDDWTSEWLSEFRKSQIEPQDLPSLGKLAEFTESELQVKIPIQDRLRGQWLAKMDVPNPGLINKLFRIDNEKPCLTLVNDVIRRVVKPVKTGTSEASFIGLWGDLICQVLDFVIDGLSDRDTSRGSSTGLNRPDFIFIVDSVCVFRGEEKAPGFPIENPKQKLVTKLDWTYGKVPYLLGYAAVSYHIALCAITCEDDAVSATELGRYDLRSLEGRFQWLLALLNVVRLFKSLARLCPDSARGEFRQIPRGHGITIYFDHSSVFKLFPEELYQNAKHHVEAVYDVLERHKVPHVDSLVRKTTKENTLVFKPRGEERKPANLVELFQALVNVLEALVKLHAASWMHRDIRWPNVMKRLDANSWFLIDFMDAAKSPQNGSSDCHLTKEEHAPEIFQGNGHHTTAVDVWAVGLLIRKSRIDEWNDKGKERTKFLNDLMQEDPLKRPTAQEALAQLRQLEQAYNQPQRGKGKKRQKRE
ncbi:unnamed protein product [Aphanomyces euteiches]